MHKDDPGVQDLEKTICEYKNTVYGIALTMLMNKSDTDDVFQEVFLLYYLKQLSFDNEAAKRAWLIRTTVFKCRQQNSSKWNQHIDKTDEFNGDISLETQEDKEVYSAVMELPQKIREAVYLHCFVGLSVNETAKILGVRANTVSMRLNRAKKLLRKRLEGDL